MIIYPNQDELFNKRSQVVRLIGIYFLTIKLMADIPFNTFLIIA